MPYYNSPQLLGKLTNHSYVYGYSIKNSKGMQLNVINYGAAVTHLYVPIGNSFTDVVMGFNSIEDYENSFKVSHSPYFGAIVGRIAGRIAQASYSVNGQTIHLSANQAGHHIHGGFESFSQKIWHLKELTHNKITLSYLSKDGEEGFPGNLQTNVTYEITEDNTWHVTIEAISDADTIANFTQHSYFNLDDTQTNLSNHLLQMPAKELLETKDMIPTGKLLSVENTNYNFNHLTTAPQAIDVTFVNQLNNQPVVCLQSLTNRLQMQVYTNQPATHVYVGVPLHPALTAKNNKQYNHYSSICFEAQHYPDAVHHANFPSIHLKKDELYEHKTSFSFSIF